MHPKMCAPTASKSSSLLPRPDPSDYPPPLRAAHRCRLPFTSLGGKTIGKIDLETKVRFDFFRSLSCTEILILSFVEIDEKRDWNVKIARTVKVERNSSELETNLDAIVSTCVKSWRKKNVKKY